MVLRKVYIMIMKIKKLLKKLLFFNDYVINKQIKFDLEQSLP